MSVDFFDGHTVLARQFFARNTHEMARPRNSLASLVASHSFSAANWRHRRLLLTEDLPATADSELRQWQAAYRRAATSGGARAAWEARAFESAVRALHAIDAAAATSQTNVRSRRLAAVIAPSRSIS